MMRRFCMMAFILIACLKLQSQIMLMLLKKISFDSLFFHTSCVYICLVYLH